MRRLLSLMTVLAVALGVLSALSPASAAAHPGAPWVSAQVVTRGTVTVSLDWDFAGPGSYEVLVSTAGPDVYPGDAVQMRVPASATHADVQGLVPGTTYCYAVTLDKNGGERSCKVTPPASRAVVPTATPTTAATFNLRCGSKSKCNSGWKWKKRQRQVVADIDRMNADIMVFVEGHVAHKYGKKKRWIGKAMAKRGYTLACLTQKSKKRRLYSQTLYVRTSVYDVVDAKHNSKGSRFKRFGDRDHGFCQALLSHRASGKQVAVAAIHLRDGKADGVRQQETAYVLNRVTSAFPGRPTVVLGDFNSHRGLDRRGQTDTPRVVMEAAGFADASDIAAHLTYPHLNSAHAFKTDPPRSSTWPTHVDRIFVSPGITVPNWDNIAVLSGGRYATPMASDHNPIRATLYIP
ncbi:MULTISPECIES: endonuclease/exonuclease/phosphatase family protein [unclassified Nocardioides]|uniref:endonuclease/exonuclease/phosphatase family protein n=1 Tax=unclassified Nocardioides TaxID=2615069 RepID=UPI00114EA1C6|nr:MULTISPECIES: endonuclease/exonuclease/phosphatase family protein [unclassified Nocardioides]TQK71672.1 endonuclease/exonuclease/phosphatase family protein [Nocardioides sp. SLBN-35]WGY04151.1 endonuclease/exonuclease/phosphatase family protein [Nocardioides sp. QY071]